VTDSGESGDVLVVDDERRIAEIVRDYLRHAGYGVRTVATGEAALAAVRTSTPDLIVLDLRLPDLDGVEIARRVRRESPVPIIMLTARAEESDRLLGLDAGADDYIVKPFSPRELVARVKAVLRRTGRPAGVLRLGDLVLEPALKRVRRGDEAIDLTTTEFRLMSTLAAQPGRIFTRAHLLDAIRGEDTEAFDRAVDAHVKNLRRKIERDPRRPRYLLTVYGMGYKAADS
jgi:DNA-binding response OmpR family regulator